MDSLGDLLPFLVGAGYLLLRFAGAARKAGAARAAAQPAPAEPPPVRRRNKAPSVFRQIVSQFEEQLNERPPRRAAEPPAVRPPDSRLDPRPVPPRSEFVGTEGSWTTTKNRAGLGTVSQGGFGREKAGFEHTVTDYKHRRHGFGDPSLEARQSLEEATPVGAFDAGRRTPDAAAPPPVLTARLRSPQAIREAFVLQTILARRPPLTRRRAGLQPRA